MCCALFVYVLCAQCCQLLGLSHSWLPLGFSLTCIYLFTARYAVGALVIYPQGSCMRLVLWISLISWRWLDYICKRRASRVSKSFLPVQLPLRKQQQRNVNLDKKKHWKRTHWNKTSLLLIGLNKSIIDTLPVLQRRWLDHDILEFEMHYVKYILIYLRRKEITLTVLVGGFLKAACLFPDQY